ncbi:MAG: hypothetical protein Aureis2KO_17690 [Aureisphaera sp.]
MKLHRILSITLLLFLFFSSYSGYSQDRENYALLWEISHLDSSKKSYLFGTFHSQDPKVFKFSDSVIPAIKNTEAFAMEIHPDSMTSSLLKTMFKDIKKNVYKEVLSEEEYERLDKRYEELHGKSLDSAPFLNPTFIETRLTKDVPKEDEMETFLDVYLYGIAKYYNNDVYGLEKVEDQLPNLEDIPKEEIREEVLEILDSDEEESENYVQFLKEVYYQGDIEKLYEEIAGSTPFNVSLNRRNHVMADNMERIMKEKSLFTAVGAAHLSGEEGIISLMRKKGFVVSKVAATFNEDPTEFDFSQEINLDEWYHDRIPELGFELKLPSEPQPINIKEGLFSRMSMDMVTGRFFAYMAVDFRGKQIKEGYDFTESVLAEQIQGDTTKIVSRRQFEKFGHQIDEVVVNKDEGVLKMQIIRTDQIVYAFMVQSQAASTNMAQSNAFFNSIVLFPPEVPIVEWDTFEPDLGAMSISMPGEIKDISREVANPQGEELPPYIMNMYMAQDKANNMLYIMRYNDQPKGHYIMDNTTYEEELIAHFSSMGTIISGPTQYKERGLEGLEFEISLGNGYNTLVRFFMRGNRTYVLLAQKTVADEKVDRTDTFFKSFEYSDYKTIAFDSILNLDNKYEMRVPSSVSFESNEFYISEAKFDSLHTYYGTMDETGGNYGMERTFLRPYSEYTSYENAYDEYTEWILEEGDSIIKTKDVKISGVPAREVLIKNNKQDIQQKLRMVLHDRSIFLFLAYANEEELSMPSSQQFFDAFKIKKFKSDFDPFAPKRKKFFKNLKSKDSVVFYEAKSALRYLTFDANDTPALLKILNKPLLDEGGYYNTRQSIINTLASIGDAETFEKVKEYYLKAYASESNRAHVLPTFLTYKVPSAEEVYFDFLKNRRPKRENNGWFNVFYPLSDSLERIEANQERLIELMDVPNYRDGIVGLYNGKIYNDSLSKHRLLKMKEHILTHLVQDTKGYVDTVQRKEKPHLNYSLISNYLNIIRRTNTKSQDVSESLQLLTRETENSDWLKTQSIITSLHLGYDVDESVLLKKMEDPYSRFEIMEELVKAQKQEIIPKDYLAKDQFTYLSFYNRMGYDDEYPDKIETLGNVMNDGIEYRVFSFSYDAYDGGYFGVAELKAAELDDFNMNECFVNWEELDKENWSEQAQELINSN